MFTVVMLNDLCETRVLYVTCKDTGLVSKAVEHQLITDEMGRGADLETALVVAQDWEVVCVFEGTLKNLVP